MKEVAAPAKVSIYPRTNDVLRPSTNHCPRFQHQGMTRWIEPKGQKMTLTDTPTIPCCRRRGQTLCWSQLKYLSIYFHLVNSQKTWPHSTVRITTYPRAAQLRKVLIPSRCPTEISTAPRAKALRRGAGFFSLMSPQIAPRRKNTTLTFVFPACWYLITLEIGLRVQFSRALIFWIEDFVLQGLQKR